MFFVLQVSAATRRTLCAVVAASVPSTSRRPPALLAVTQQPGRGPVSVPRHASSVIDLSSWCSTSCRHWPQSDVQKRGLKPHAAARPYAPRSYMDVSNQHHITAALHAHAACLAMAHLELCRGSIGKCCQDHADTGIVLALCRPVGPEVHPQEDHRHWPHEDPEGPAPQVQERLQGG